MRRQATDQEKIVAKGTSDKDCYPKYKRTLKTQQKENPIKK